MSKGAAYKYLQREQIYQKKKKNMTRNDIHFAVRQVGSRNRALNMFETDTLIILM